MKPIHILPWLAALAAAATAQAQPPEGPGGQRPPHPPTLAFLDTNRDRSLSAEELAAAGEVLLALDTDEDGSVSLAEFLEGTLPPKPEGEEEEDRPAPPAPPLFRLLDTDEDGSLSTEEANAAAQIIAKKFDKDGDGSVSREEMKPKHGPRGHGKNHRPPGPPPGEEADAPAPEEN